MTMTEEDLKIIKVKYGKKLAEVCMDFIKETGMDGIDFHALTVDSTYTTDKSGNACYGTILNINLDCWETDDDEDDD